MDTVTIAIPGLGQVQGTADADITAFKGIPYAAAPVGPLRWRPPQPPAPWEGVRWADMFAPGSLQAPPRGYKAEPGEYAEDCLYLNIWRPRGAKADARLPVMVWIHGGGFVFGSGASPMNDGAGLARHGVIVVTLNYRLARFGWFAHPQLTAEAGDQPTANFGLMDQIAALRWIQAHISAFGGDPGNVTIFGVSAGARSVHMLMSAPGVDGLFAKAIAQTSGPRMRFRALSVAEGYGQALSEALGAATLEELRALPAEAIASARMPDEHETAPILDGRLVTEDVDVAFGHGAPAKIPHLLGTNDFEASNWPDAVANPEATLSRFPDELRAAVLAAYGGGSSTPDLRAVVAGTITDRVCTEPARYVAQQHARRGLPTYRYVFAYVPEALRDKVPGVGHAAEQPFVFNTLDSVAAWRDRITNGDRRAADLVGRYWTNFARTGDPNGDGLPEWPRDGDDILMLFTAEGPRAEHGYLKSRLDLWASVAQAG